MAEETTAASHSLTEEVVNINRMLGAFKTGSDSGQQSGAPAAMQESAPSQVHALNKQVANAFTIGNTAIKQDEWEEF